MIPDKPPKEDVFHGSEDLKKEAHISSFEKYKELYLKSIENPDGTCPFIESQSINQSSVRWRSFSEEVHLPHVTSRHHLTVKYCVKIMHFVLNSSTNRISHSCRNIWSKHSTRFRVTEPCHGSVFHIRIQLSAQISTTLFMFNLS